MSKGSPTDTPVIADVEAKIDQWNQEYRFTPLKRQKGKIFSKNPTQPTTPPIVSTSTEQGRAKKIEDVENKLELAKKKLEFARRLKVVLDWIRTIKTDPDVEQFVQEWKAASLAGQGDNPVDAERQVSALENKMRQKISGGEKNSQGPSSQEKEKGPVLEKHVPLKDPDKSRELIDRLKVVLNWLPTMKTDPNVKDYANLWQNAKWAAEKENFVEAERDLSTLEKVMRTGSSGGEKKAEQPSSQETKPSEQKTPKPRPREAMMGEKDPTKLTQRRLDSVELWLASIKGIYEMAPVYQKSLLESQEASAALKGGRLKEAQDKIFLLEKRRKETDAAQKLRAPSRKSFSRTRNNGTTAIPTERSSPALPRCSSRKGKNEN